MELIDHIILFNIAGWAVTFHGMMVATDKNVANGRLIICLVFAVLGISSLLIKAGLVS